MNPSAFARLAVLLVMGVCDVAPVRAAEFADLILHGGKIAVVDAAFSIAEAIAVKDGKVLRAGPDASVLSLRGPSTEILDLRGKLVIPGLIDSHSHAANACLTEFDHPIPDMEKIADVLGYIKERAAIVPAGEWIVVQQIFITRLNERRYPSRAELDAAAPQHPVLFRTGPDASLNSLAMKLNGITRDFKVDDGGSGFAEKDPQTGEPTGILRNCTRYVNAKPRTKTPTPEQHEERLRQLLADYNSVGITTIGDRDTSLEGLERYQGLRQRSALTVRVRCSQDIPSVGDLSKIVERIRSVGRSELRQNGDDWLKIIGIKTYLDGGMLTGSAFMREPWGVSSMYGITDPAYRGVCFIPHDRLLAMARAAVESGLQFTAHSQGDAAVEALVAVYDELADAGLPVAQTRSSVTHASFMTPDVISRAAKLGVMFDHQPAWLYLDTKTLTGHFGRARLRWFIPLRSLFAAGVVTGGGSDHMQKIGSMRSNNPYNPFLAMAVAVTRRAKGVSEPLYPEEALTREQALRFYTVNNARLLAMEDRVGSLEPGKLADLAVLDRDLLVCPESDIAGTTVDRAYVGGKLVYEKR